MNFRQGFFTQPPHQNEPLKSPPRLGLIVYNVKSYFHISDDILKVTLVSYLVADFNFSMNLTANPLYCNTQSFYINTNKVYRMCLQ